MRSLAGIILAVVFTADQMRSAECAVACRFTGTEGGVYWREKCFCYNAVDYYEIVNRQRLYLPKKSKASVLVSPSYTEPEKETENYRGYPKEIDDYLY